MIAILVAFGIIAVVVAVIISKSRKEEKDGSKGRA